MGSDWGFTKIAFFTIVDASSSYNAIIGRSVLKDLWVITSTYQKLKFSASEQEGVLNSDQRVARKCYESEVRQKGKRAKKEACVGMEIPGGGRSKKQVNILNEWESEIVGLAEDKKVNQLIDVQNWLHGSLTSP